VLSHKPSRFTVTSDQNMVQPPQTVNTVTTTVTATTSTPALPGTAPITVTTTGPRRGRFEVSDHGTFSNSPLTNFLPSRSSLYTIT
jgi:hypothetical protein